jgi:hypothetical protein
MVRKEKTMPEVQLLVIKKRYNFPRKFLELFSSSAVYKVLGDIPDYQKALGRMQEGEDTGLYRLSDYCRRKKNDLENEIKAAVAAE